MTERTVPVTEEELHAFVDGELASDRRHEVEAWLAAHPEDAARVAGWQAQGEAIRARYATVIDEPLPERLDLDRLVRARSGWRWRLAAAAVLLVAFLGGGLAGWFGRDLMADPEATLAVAPRSLVADALDAHRLYIAEVRHPVEVPADAKHLMPWLSRKVGHQLRAPNLKDFGLKLIGGRLLPSPASPAALFMYEGASGDRYTLYCARTGKPDTALRFKQAGLVAAFYWVDAEVSYVLSGPADRERLLAVAEAAYGQMDGRLPARRTDLPATSQIR